MMGVALMTALVDACRAQNVMAIHVEVDPGNVAAMALYGKFGLRPACPARLTLTARP